MLKNIKSKILFFIRKHFFDGITIRKNATVSSSKLSEWVHISNNTNIVESNIGRYSSIGKFSNIFYVEMGAFCSISWNVTIGATQHNINYLTTHAFPYISMFDLTTSNQRKKRKTKIGHDVWIGTGAIIMPGISVGNGSVIGAGSIVTKDVKAYSIVAGNPAKLIRMRFDGDLINKIESLKWWHWDSSYLRDNIDVFKQNISSSILNSIDSH